MSAEELRLVLRALRHLEDVGFTGAPRFLGIDRAEREALTFVPGQVAGRPWPEWVADLDRARSVARLVRRLDDAMVLLGVPDDGVVAKLVLDARMGQNTQRWLAAHVGRGRG